MRRKQARSIEKITTVVAILALFLGAGVVSHAQRHGRSDSVQNYVSGLRDYTITIRYVREKWRYTTSDLSERVLTPHSARSDPGSSVTTGGVPLSDLLPTAFDRSNVVRYDVRYGFYHTRAISASDLGDDILITDRTTGRFTDRLSPVRLVIYLSDKRMLIIDDVHEVALRTTGRKT